MRKSTPWGVLSFVSFVLSALVIVAVPKDFSPQVRNVWSTDRPSYSEIFGQQSQEKTTSESQAKATLATELVAVTEPSWCNPCKLLEPVLDRVQEAGYKVKKIDRYEWWKEHPEAKRIRKWQEKPNDLSVVRFPTLFFLDAQGKVVTKRFGFKGNTFESITNLLEKP